jgi:chromosome segregation ATPase
MMSQTGPQRDIHRNGSNGKADGSAHHPRRGADSVSTVHDWGHDDSLRQEVAEMVAEIEQLRGENAELRARAEAAEQLHTAGSAGQAGKWEDRQREYEALLEEKSEVIRALHHKIQELRDAGNAAGSEAGGEAGGEASPPASEWQELERVKVELEQQRHQLEEDEESLMAQMRQMEMTMSRERAELARQRSELQRLHNDLRHEMETAARDAGLRDRLMPLQRRQQEAARGGAAGETSQGSDPNLSHAMDESSAKKNSSSFFRRLFGG